MNFISYLQKMFSLKATVTNLALVFSSPQMHRQMLGQVSLLGEALVAAGLLAHEGSLTGMNA